MAKMKKILTLALVLCMCFSLFAVQAFADGEEPVYVAKIGENSYETLAAAVAVGGEIELLKDVELDAAITVALDTTIKGAHTITRAAGYTGTLFSVSKGATLTLDGGVILDGGNNWSFDSEGYYADMEACLTLSSGAKSSYTTSNGTKSTDAMVNISGGGAVVMNAATIQNNWGSTLFTVPADASLTTNDGSLIKHIHGFVAGNGSSGGVKGSWTMNGGKIDDVFGHNTNGALADVRGGVITVNDGEITNVRTLGLNSNGNGILFQIYGESSKLNINGGWIHSNASFSPGNGWGAAVYLNRGGDFTMTGGVIEDTKSDICTAFVSNTATSIELLGGTIEVNNDTHTTRFESLFCGDVVIGENMNIVGEDGAVFLMLGEVSGDKLDIDGQVSGEGTMWLMPIEPVTGEGTVTSDVLVKTHKYYPAADVTLTGANWNCLITVDSVGSEATLFVKPGANVTDGLVRVLESVPSGDYLNGEESAAAQASAYVEDDGANVTSPVLYYHRLTAAQKSAIVVTYDYNGGLDAQGWSGCQLTTAEEAAMADPQPTKPGYVLAGWVYASELDPESLSMAGTEDYNGEAIGKTTRLIAQWELDIPTYTVTYEYTGTVPADAPELPAAEYYFPGDLVSIEADENYKVTDYTFSGWQDPCNYLSNGIMPAHDVTLTGYYVPVNANVDPPIGIKTDKETTGNDYEVKIEVPGDGDAVKIHDEVILIIDGSYSMDEEWEDMKANIVEIGKKVLGGAGRTQMTVISFGMDDNIVVEGIKTVDELKAMLPALPGGLLYGRSSTNCEVGFTGALNYIQSKQDELAKVDVIFISDGGVNNDETPRVFDTNWQKFSTCFGALTVVKEGICGAYDKGVDIPAMAVFGSRFDGMSKDEIIAAVVGGSVPEEELLAFGDKVWADVYAHSGLTPGKEYPISVVERAFVKYDKDKGTYVQDIFYYSTYKSSYVTYGDMYNRSVAAAEDLAASSLVDELYLLQYANHGRGWWVKDIEDGKNYYKAENVAGLLDNVGPMLTELSNTNYKDVVITDYMSKWVLLHTDSIRIVNDTTGKTIWSIKDGWAADAEKPTTAEPPVTVEKVDPADYAAGGADVEGNKNGDIYKITWHVKDDCLLRTDNYSLRYTVTVDVKEEGLELGKEYPANGNTDVQYIDGEGNTHKYPIDVPNVTVPAYTVTYINGKTVLQETDGLMTGDDITDYEGDTPTKAQTGNTAYRFNGWKLVEGTPDGDKIGTTDLVYEAQYKKVILNGDGYVNIPDDDIPLAPVPEVFTDDHYAYIVGYPDGSVQPGGQITRAEVATIFFRLLTEEVRQANMVSENEFSDVNPGNWFNNAVSTMAAMGIVNGYPDGSFRPNAPITRAEFAAIASRFDANASEEGDWFSDISGHWAEKAIIKAVNNGWIKGYDDGTFRPNQNITRAEAMTLVNRVLHRLPGSPADLLDDMIKWPDNADTEAWYYLAVQEATNSHHYSRETEESEFETWLEMREARDWTELEY